MGNLRWGTMQGPSGRDKVVVSLRDGQSGGGQVKVGGLYRGVVSCYLTGLRLRVIDRVKGVFGYWQLSVL